MGDISKNFSRNEFSCRCGCGFDTVDAELLWVLQQIRDHYGKPVVITSGCRCVKHNERVKGASSSQHVHAKAADIYISEISPKDLFDYLNAQYPDQYGLGFYEKNGFVHVDVRTQKARWIVT